MIKSDLVTVVVPAHSNNYRKGRNGYKICKFTPHHMSGNLTVEKCGEIFQSPTRGASANYGIGSDGRIACYVSEENRPLTSSSKSNDCQAITVEVANCERGGQWRISDKAWDSLVKLAVDVCRRYNFRLTYDGTPKGSLTRHNMFANTDCPGPYLQSRFPELAQTVNAILDGGSADFKEGQKVVVYMPIAVCHDNGGDKLFVENLNQDINGRKQFWIHRSCVENNYIHALGTICYVEGEQCLVQVFDEQFWCKKENLYIDESLVPKTKQQNIKSTVGQKKKLKTPTKIYSNSNLTGIEYNYKTNTTVQILANVTSEIDKVHVIATGREGFISTNSYK